MVFRKTRFHAIAGCCVILLATACNGMFDGVYDDPQDEPATTDSQIYIDASSWQNWYYVSFDSLEQLRVSGDMTGLRRAQTHFTAYPIPMAATGERTATHPAQGSTGIYTYWFDVFGQGLSVNEFRAFTPTAAQPEPEHWDIAIHYDDVRTNGGAALETNYTSMDDLPPSSADFSGTVFTPDEWTENIVWADQAEQLNKILGCQGIYINKVLSSWLEVEMKSLPPEYTHNNHVFIVRLANGSHVALQLQNYLSASGERCWLTINYKYPY